MRMLLIPALGLATGAATVTVCKAKITAPIRRVFSRVRLFEELFDCLYCASHWVAAGLVLATRPDIGAGSDPMNLLVSWLAVVTIAAPAMFLINWSHGSMQWSSEPGLKGP